jgi:hypothetical protein
LSDDPTTGPVDFPALVKWRGQQKNAPATAGAVFDEFQRLVVVGIGAIFATRAVPGLLSDRMPEVVPAEKVEQYQLVEAEVGTEVFGEIIKLSRRDFRLVPLEPALPVYGELKFQIIEPAVFQQYLDGELAAFGLPPPPAPDDEPSGLPDEPVVSPAPADILASDQGASDLTKREARKRDKRKMYKHWLDLAVEHRLAPNGTPRTRRQILQAVARDPRARDPITQKLPAADSVRRRLDEHHPGWEEKIRQPGGQKISAILSD